jgi:spore coat polysaccharide biosynthesis protein SpsF (cytidylyltransferase family)
MPGKVLRRAAGRSLLEWVVQAVSETDGIEGVCVAVPDGEAHEPVAREARRLCTTVARGSEHDVLSRFAQAAEFVDASRIMRVTTDCPMSDPRINAEVLALLSEPGVDYACNNQPFGYPHGLDCEVFTRDALIQADREASDPYDREHVTPWLRRASHLLRRNLAGPGGLQVSWRFTVDYPEDFALFQEISGALGKNAQNSVAVNQYVTENPQIHEINRVRRQR